MKLLTVEVLKRLPPLYSQENTADPVCQVKFFTPDANWTWYAIEGSPQEGEYHPGGDMMFFGYVVGLEKELGYFALSELQSIRGRFRLPVERDRYWEPRTLSQVKKDHRDVG